MMEDKIFIYFISINYSLKLHLRLARATVQNPNYLYINSHLTFFPFFFNRLTPLQHHIKYICFHVEGTAFITGHASLRCSCLMESTSALRRGVFASFHMQHENIRHRKGIFVLNKWITVPPSN